MSRIGFRMFSLPPRLVRGGAILGAVAGVEQGLRFLRNMILTRLLAPEILGVMAIVLSINGLFQMVSGIGIREAVIQYPAAEDRKYLNGVWWIALSRGLLLYVVAFFAAPAIARFYEAAELTDLLRIAFLAPIARGMESPRAYIALKKMQYGRWVAIEQLGGMIGIGVTLVLAFAFRNVWALVIGFVVESFARMFLSFLLCPFLPGVQFTRTHLQALLRYARGIFGLPLLALIYGQAGVIVLGKTHPKEELGLYSMSLSLARIPSALSAVFLKPLLMPAFAEVQNDAQRLNRGLLRVSEAIIYPSLPLLAFVALTGADILHVVYGPAYRAAAAAFVWLVANEILINCNVPLAQLFLATGRPELLRRASLVRAVLVVLLIYPMIRWAGMPGAAMTSVLGMGAGYAFQLKRAQEIAGIDIRHYLAFFLRAAVFALPVVAAWAIGQTMLPPAPAAAWMRLAIDAGLCGLLYGVCAILAFRLPRLRRLLAGRPVSRGASVDGP